METNDTSGSIAVGTADTTPGATRQNIVSGAHQAVDRLAGAAAQASNTLNEKTEELKTRGAAMVDCTRDYIVRKPFTAMGIAVATGFLLRHMMCSRS
jgi:ElaB/YqjD/DUF883 family membrane-anchored ribosome-binding protein